MRDAMGLLQRVDDDFDAARPALQRLREALERHATRVALPPISEGAPCKAFIFGSYRRFRYSISVGNVFCATGLKICQLRRPALARKGYAGGFCLGWTCCCC